MGKILPHKLTFRISKTGEARSGAELYKRRNSRSYRGLMQYVTWNKLMTGEITPNILSQYGNGCLVWLSPKEYFGDNYPERADKLNPKFILGKTGFIYYTSIEEYRKFPPLENWKELYELETKGKRENDNSWVGDYCLNIKNTSHKKISEICKDSEAKKSDIDINMILQNYGVELPSKKLPKQCGIGNYDYDYANEEMIENVKLQMLYMALACEDSNGQNFKSYLKSNYQKLLTEGKDATFVKNINSNNYDKMYDEFFLELKQECEEKRLLNFVELQKVNAWNTTLNRPICPLCGKTMTANDFFQAIEQAEGRKVQDNTQRAIVLMHINALRSGQLNHRIYNLGWGHNFCNAIQGDKNIEDTIAELKRVVETFEKNTGHIG